MTPADTTGALLAAALADDEPAACHALIAGAAPLAALRQACHDDAAAVIILSLMHPADLPKIQLDGFSEAVSAYKASIELETLKKGVQAAIDDAYFKHLHLGRSAHACLFRTYGPDLISLIARYSPGRCAVELLLGQTTEHHIPQLSRLAALLHAGPQDKATLDIAALIHAHVARQIFLRIERASRTK